MEGFTPKLKQFLTNKRSELLGLTSSLINSSVLGRFYALGIISDAQKKTIAPLNGYDQADQLYDIIASNATEENLGEIIKIFEMESMKNVAKMFKGFKQDFQLEKNKAGVKRRVENAGIHGASKTSRWCNEEHSTTDSEVMNTRDKIPPNQDSDPNCEPFDTIDGDGDFKPVTLKDVDDAAASVLKMYRSGATYKGIALIINVTFNGTRLGAPADTVALRSTLTTLKYDVRELDDPTQAELKKFIDFYESQCDYNDADSLLLALMSHGNGVDDDVIKTSDHKDICIWKDVVERFNNENCKGLKGKPKIFLLNFCRGKNMSKGTTKGDDAQDVIHFSKNEMIPSWTDMMVCFSTFQGHVSNRNEVGGTWFIQTFCTVLNNLDKFKPSKDYDLKTLLEVISKLMASYASKSTKSEELRGLKQICPFYNIGFNKKFYFKIFPD